MSGAIIARRLQEECGVEFPNGAPTHAHYSNHGNLADTFLAYQLIGGRINNIVPWRWRGKQGLQIALQSEVPARRLARVKRLKVEVDNSFSGYGLGLFVSDPDWKP